VRARVLTKARSLHEKKQPSVAPLLPMLVLFFLLEGGSFPFLIGLNSTYNWAFT
jgi:hypothetical protein